MSPILYALLSWLALLAVMAFIMIITRFAVALPGCKEFNPTVSRDLDSFTVEKVSDHGEWAYNKSHREAERRDCSWLVQYYFFTHTETPHIAALHFCLNNCSTWMRYKRIFISLGVINRLLYLSEGKCPGCNAKIPSKLLTYLQLNGVNWKKDTRL